MNTDLQPTAGRRLTHGEVGYGAGVFAAWRLGARLVDVRVRLNGIKEVLATYPPIGRSQSDDQCHPGRSRPGGNPVDPRKVLSIDKPAACAFYDLEDVGGATLEQILKGASSCRWTDAHLRAGSFGPTGLVGR